jgi:antitoxin-like ribbon-helix-helix protein
VAGPRKLIGFDPETLRALELYAKDVGKSLQDLADEAFADLLAKHQRPRTFKEALKQSSRREPANENRPPKRRG